jgi:hypothetical protein
MNSLIIFLRFLTCYLDVIKFNFVRLFFFLSFLSLVKLENYKFGKWSQLFNKVVRLFLFDQNNKQKVILAFLFWATKHNKLQIFRPILLKTRYSKTIGQDFHDFLQMCELH